MKKLLICLTLLISISSYADCPEEKSAKKIINIFDSAIDIYPKTSTWKSLFKVTNAIRVGAFCNDLYLQLGLCNDLVVEKVMDNLKLAPMRLIPQLEKAMFEYGNHFDAPGESNGFTCNLKNLKFSF